MRRIGYRPYKLFGIFLVLPTWRKKYGFVPFVILYIVQVFVQIQYDSVRSYECVVPRVQTIHPASIERVAPGSVAGFCPARKIFVCYRRFETACLRSPTILHSVSSIFGFLGKPFLRNGFIRCYGLLYAFVVVLACWRTLVPRYRAVIDMESIS